MVHGESPVPGPLAASDGDLAPLGALEQAVLPALARPPCLVSFSGGRDSSSILAVATRVARREGLPEPIPASVRYLDAPQTEESQWQELVVRHLGLTEWNRREILDDLDYLGPVARGVLSRHGVLWPPNVHVHAPLLDDAREGSLLTGVDGDGLLGGWRWQSVVDVLARRAHPGKHSVRALAAAAAPKRVRRVSASARHFDLGLTWLREGARRAVTKGFLKDRSDEPVWWDRRVAWWGRRRYHAACRWSLGLLAADAEVLLVHPLLDAEFHAALARAGGRLGFGDRTAVMRALFSDLLPDEILARQHKAIFDQAFWRSETRRFAASWDGGGVDTGLVDERSLRTLWGTGQPEFRTVMLLQSAFLASSGQLIEDTVSDDR